MANGYRRGYGWSLPPLIDRALPTPRDNRGVFTSQIRIFSAKGIAAPGTLGTAPLPQIGVPIAGTNLLYVRPRLSQDPLGGFDGTVFPYVPYRWPGQPEDLRYAPYYREPARIIYTNPAFSYYRENRRTPSIGMAGAGQMGASMDVPFQSEVGWFGVPTP